MEGQTRRGSRDEGHCWAYMHIRTPGVCSSCSKHRRCKTLVSAKLFVRIFSFQCKVEVEVQQLPRHPAFEPFRQITWRSAAPFLCYWPTAGIIIHQKDDKCSQWRKAAWLLSNAGIMSAHYHFKSSYKQTQSSFSKGTFHPFVPYAFGCFQLRSFAPQQGIARKEPGTTERAGGEDSRELGPQTQRWGLRNRCWKVQEMFGNAGKSIFVTPTLVPQISM